MAYQIVTDICYTPSDKQKLGANQVVVTYPESKSAYLDKKSKVISLPSGLMFKHAEELANILSGEHGFFASYAIVKTKENK